MPEDCSHHFWHTDLAAPTTATASSTDAPAAIASKNGLRRSHE
jgi:hypothetical protein